MTALYLLGVALVVSITISFFQNLLFPAWINKWSVTQSPPATQVDALFVLGGGHPFRPTAAAKLWHQGLAKNIYVFGSEEDLMTKTLLEHSVPESAIINISTPVDSTYDEAIEVASIVNQSNFQQIIAPTDHFHSPRVRWIFDKHLPKNCQLTITEAPFHYYQTTNWWKHKNGRTRMRSEIAKLAYYKLRY